MATILTQSFSSDSEDEDFVPIYDPEDLLLTDENGKIIKSKKNNSINNNKNIGLKRNLNNRNSNKILKKIKNKIGADVLSDEDENMESIIPTNISNPIEVKPAIEEKSTLLSDTPKISDKINSLWDSLKSSSIFY